MDEHSLNKKSLSGIFNKKVIASLVLGAAGLFGLSQTVYIVDESERTMIKQFGSLQGTGENGDGIIGPGIHIKLPIISDAVSFSTRPKQLELVNMSTGTKDNQPLWADLTIVYQVTEAAIPRLIREPGWEDRIRSVAASRYKSVLGAEDILKIPERRAAINIALTEQIATAVAEEIGVTVTDVQLVNYEVDPELQKRIEEIARSKAEVEKAKQLRDQAAIDAETKKKVAEGEAAKTEEEARGRAAATKLEADANAYALEKEGAAKANALTVQMNAVGNPQVLVDLANADAWKSGGAQMPSTLVTGGETTTLVAPAVDTATKAVVASAKPAATMTP